MANATKKPTKKKPKTKAPRRTLRQEVTHTIKLPGRRMEGSYDSRWVNTTADVTMTDEKVTFRVECQTVKVSRSEMRRLGVGIFKVPEVMETLPPLEGFSWGSVLTLECPVDNEGKRRMNVSVEPSGGVDYVMFRNFSQYNRYQFKVEMDTFKELTDCMNKRYKVVEED